MNYIFALMGSLVWVASEFVLLDILVSIFYVTLSPGIVYLYFHFEVEKVMHEPTYSVH